MRRAAAGPAPSRGLRGWQGNGENRPVTPSHKSRTRGQCVERSLQPQASLGISNGMGLLAT